MVIQIAFVRPSIWIPACEIVWTSLTMSMAAAKNVETMYVLRFFVGLAEACAFPGYAALLGGWYGPNQLSKRMAIFEQTSALAGMFSGYLQSGLYTGLNGHLGLKGWRWLFLFDGIISMPIAIWGVFAIPDLPHTTRAFYWTEDVRFCSKTPGFTSKRPYLKLITFQPKDKKYGIERVERMGQKGPQPLKLSVMKRVYSNWRLWVFILAYV